MISTYEGLLLYLYIMPGIISLIVYENVAEVKKRDAFERVGIAVFLTIIIAYLSSAVFGTTVFPEIGEATKEKIPSIFLSFLKENMGRVLVVAIISGVIFAIIQNSGIVFTILRKIKVTNRTGKIDVWHQIFSRNEGMWIQLVFNNGDILIGWPKYASEESEERAIFLARATWHYLVQKIEVVNGTSIPPVYREEDVQGPGVMITNFDAVRSVEFLD